MLGTGIVGWLKLRGLPSQATEGVRAIGGRQGEEIAAAMLDQVMKSVSFGYGSYIALAAALALAWIVPNLADHVPVVILEQDGYSLLSRYDFDKKSFGVNEMSDDRCAWRSLPMLRTPIRATTASSWKS